MLEGAGGRQHGEKRFASGGGREPECTVGSDETTCSISTPSSQQPHQEATGAPVFQRTLGTLGRIKNRFASREGRRQINNEKMHDCCSEFESCVIGNPHSLAACTLMRGGHLTGSAAAAAASAETLGQVAVKHMPYGIPLNGWKVIFQAILTTINVVCWLIPLRSKQISENKLALSLANAFSGGVFLSLAFGHLIPECVHGFEGLTNEVTPYLLVLSGYLLIFFVEKVAFDAHEILHEMENAHGHKIAAATNGGSMASIVPGAIPADSNMSGSSGSIEDDLAVATNGSSTSGRSALILLGALAVHSILEMAALGLADTFSDSAILTLSIALHQVRVLFSFEQMYASIRVMARNDFSDVFTRHKSAIHDVLLFTFFYSFGSVNSPRSQ
jgi:hypothetical protein